MDEDRSDSIRHSLSEDNVSTLGRSTFANANEVIRNLTDRLRDAESENTALKRNLPRLRNSDGQDVTAKFIELGNELEVTKEENEQLAKKYKTLENRAMQREAQMQKHIEKLEEELRETVARADKFHQANLDLRARLEKDESVIYKLKKQTEGKADVEEEPSSIGAICHCADYEKEIAKLHAEAEEYQRKLSKRNKMIKSCMRSLGKRDSFSPEEGSLDDSDFLPADRSDQALVEHLLAVLNRLKTNWQENAVLHQQIVDLLNEKGFEVNDQGLVRFTKSFRRRLSERNRMDKQDNQEAANEYLLANPELRAHMARLDDDTSSCTGTDLGEDEESSVGGERKKPAAERVFNVSVAFDLTNNDIANRSQAVVADMALVNQRMMNMKRLCRGLFDKLRDTAFFLEKVLEYVENSEGNQSLMDKIRDLRLDLDQSMGEADMAVREITQVQENVKLLHNIIEQSFYQNTLEQSALERRKTLEPSILPQLPSNTEEVIQLRLKIEGLETQCASLKTTLNNELANKKGLKEENDQIYATLEDISAEKRSLEERIAELQSVVEDYEAAADEVVQLRKKIAGLESQSASFKTMLDREVNSKKGIREEKEDVDRQLEDVMAEKETLEARISELEGRLEEFVADAQQAKEANKIMVGKIKSGAEAAGIPFEELGLNNESSFDVEEIDEGKVADYNQFDSFLVDCEARSNKIVQILKLIDDSLKKEDYEKVAEVVVTTLKEARNLRVMLHAISKYFANQKENIHRSDVNLGKDIRRQLVEIYETLQNARTVSKSSRRQN